jgi:hypothetical protein
MLYANRSAKDTLHTPPNPDHYPNPYDWDSLFHTISYSEFGDPKSGEREMKALFRGQNQRTGFIPNVRFEAGRKRDPERYTFQNLKESSYTQPPLGAQAVLSVTESYEKSGQPEEAERFLKEIYPNLFLKYEYFRHFRENGNGSRLVGIIHPHESGRDSDPTFDFVKVRLPTNNSETPKFVTYANTVLDYASALALNIRLRKRGWNPEQIRKEGVFWVNDVMFNAIYAKNLGDMAKISEKLGYREEAYIYDRRKEAVESEIIHKMWDHEDRMFYAKDRNGNPIKKVSVSNLFPIIIPSATYEQVGKIVELLNDPAWFGTRYPIPSVPAKDKSYDPHYKEKRLWRGPAWVNMNWYIVEGLMMQAERFKFKNPELSLDCEKTALNIVGRTIEMADREGFWECYDPENGNGLRVTPFGWSALADVLRFKYESRLQPIAA